ncbi:MAG TPA: glycosyltransferase family 9 protein [Vicinamibacterales bacterium]|nr:glycosyltransferase family 9 protein [Vicinamibacterales bacterium]
MNFLIVRLGALGDVVHTIPAAAALRRAFPTAHIDWLVDARHRPIVELVTAVDRAIALERATLPGWSAVIRTLRQVPYDVAIDLQGLLKSAVLARASGAPRVVGFSIWHLREKTARPFYSDAHEAEGGHVIAKNLRLLRAVGVEDESITFPLGDVPSPALEALRHRIGPRPFALINAGAAWPNKRWPPERFGQLAAFLREACGLEPVVLWGPGEEALAARVTAGSSGTAVEAPRTGVVDLVALARAASLVVSGDTGPLHIAAAVGTPTVSLFGPTDPDRNGPFDKTDAVVSRYDACGCHYARRCHKAQWCLGGVQLAEVCAAVQRTLVARRRRG